MKPDKIQEHISSIQVDMIQSPPRSDSEVKELERRIESVRKETNQYRQDAHTDEQAADKVKILEASVEQLSERISDLRNILYDSDSNASTSSTTSHISSEGYHPEKEKYKEVIRESEKDASGAIDKDSMETVKAARGSNLKVDTSSANPVAILSKEHFMPLNEFRNLYKSETSNNKPPQQEKITWIAFSRSLLNLKDKQPVVVAFLSSLVDDLVNEKMSFYGEVTLELLHDKANVFLANSNFHAPKDIAMLLSFIELHNPENELDELLTNSESTESTVKLIKYNLNDLREHILRDIGEKLREQIQDPDEFDQHMTAMHFFVSRPHVQFGNYLSKNELDSFLKEVNEGLQTTYGITVDAEKILEQLRPQVNISELDQLWGSKIGHILNKIPGYDCKAKGAVAKGGPETYRELTMISLAKAFDLQGAVLMKDVHGDAKISVAGQGIQTAVVSPFIPDIEDTKLNQILNRLVNRYSLSRWDGPTIENYKNELKELRDKVSAESYGESLALSLVLHATDDHYKQFTTQGDRLINYDTGRNLPPTRFVVKNDGKLFIMLRTVLLDFPQFDDPLDPKVIEKIKAITPEKIENELGEKRLSEFENPFKIRGLLKEIQNKQPLTEEQQKEYLKLFTTYGNRAANRKLNKYFNTKPADPALLKSLIERAKKGCNYPRNLAIRNLECYRDFHKLNALENDEFMERLEEFLLRNNSITINDAKTYLENLDQEKVEKLIKLINKKIPSPYVSEMLIRPLKDHLSLKDYLEKTGQTFEGACQSIPHLDKVGEAKINDQIEKLKKSSVDEREVERMKEGQRKIIEKINSQDSLTGRELAETLYPEEMLFYDALRDLNFSFPSINFGHNKIDIHKIMNLVFDSDRIDEDRKQKLDLARDRMYEEAEGSTVYRKYCT